MQQCIIKDQETILETVANFYTNLFSKKIVEDIELPNLIEEKDIQNLVTSSLKI